MADITLSYKGSTIAEINESTTKTLLTEGKYCEDDIELTYVKPSGGEPDIDPITITSNGTYTASGCDGYSPITVNVPQSGAPTAEELTFSGDCSYKFYNNQWNWFINKYGSQITTSDISNGDSMFYYYNQATIPFALNFKLNGTGYSGLVMKNLFNYSRNLTTLPTINFTGSGAIQSSSRTFTTMLSIRNIPDDYFSNWPDATPHSGYTRDFGFYECYSLRNYPSSWNRIMKQASNTSPYMAPYYSFMDHCFVVDEIRNIPVVNVIYNSNVFLNTCAYCCRAKSLTFELDNGNPYIVQWKSQTFSIYRVGYSIGDSVITDYNSGLTTATKITDATSYEALKNNPDSWTTDINYSRYNHDSAVETINSLPDTSAYATNNIIKFEGAAGALTDGGAINTLTAEEIAVATAKGWTVTLV